MTIINFIFLFIFAVGFHMFCDAVFHLTDTMFNTNIMNKKFYKTMRIIIVAVGIFLLLHFDVINI